MTLIESLRGTAAPPEVISQIDLVELPFFDFNKQKQTGQLLINKTVAAEVIIIFKKLFQLSFPIEKIIPVVHFGWDDELSMRENNTSAFNYRSILGTSQLSKHALGLAIDINPLVNPYIDRNGKAHPAGAQYTPGAIGTILADGDVVKVFKQYGWIWGGDWSHQDYQHFEK